MSARMKIVYGGESYVSVVNAEMTADKMSDVFYEQLNKLDRISIKLENGNVLVIGKDVVQGSVMIFENA